ncbi:MAG: hypothetical protein HYV68_01390 [Candidatus Taylorbacteria bacterium]|nr:hypothetical protein [Candidatus Taylorbacteria bacterium]
MQNDNVKFKILSWGTWPYWGRGGIVGISTALVADVVLVLWTYASGVWPRENPELMRGVELPSVFSLQVVTGVLIVVLSGIIFGVAIGWLYGKISAKGGSASGGKNHKLSSLEPRA